MTSVPSKKRHLYVLTVAWRHCSPTLTWGFRRTQDASLLLARSYRGLIRSLNWWDAIDEQFYLGGALMFDDIERLQQQGVKAVVNLCAERQDRVQKLTEANMDYLWLPVRDLCAPSFEQIEQGIAWIQAQLQCKRVIYVHCAAGVGRSATLLACWYVYSQGLSAADAVRYIKLKHPQTSLTRQQTHCLNTYAQSFQTPSQADLDSKFSTSVENLLKNALRSTWNAVRESYQWAQVQLRYGILQSKR